MTVFQIFFIKKYLVDVFYNYQDQIYASETIFDDHEKKLWAFCLTTVVAAFIENFDPSRTVTLF